jgi:threonine/homoserine/homoserine lactone efflux protein
METVYSVAMLVSLGTFTFSSTMTPGPNNIMLLSSGLTFGYKRSIPHITGVVVGFPFMVFLIGIGLGIVFNNFPIILTLLKIIGMLYLLWMAYKIATNVDSYNMQNTHGKPFSFFQAVLFQWVNPKAWIMAITVISLFVTSQKDSLLQIMIVVSVYILSAVISTNIWALGGVFLKRVLQTAKMVSIFNKIMAFLLVVSIIPFVID